uniref:Uncharacterized protein n=1 Tax=Cyanistes caeruleus TaxID=156563 RepID=A0A8C0VDU7_CYACU
MSQYLPENLFKKYCVIENCTKTLPAPPPLLFLLPLPAFLLPFFYNRKYLLRELHLPETLPEFLHSADISPATPLEKSWLGYTPQMGVVFEAVLNNTRIPVLNSHWCISSAIEHKTAIFQIFCVENTSNPSGLNIHHPAGSGFAAFP